MKASACLGDVHPVGAAERLELEPGMAASVVLEEEVALTHRRHDVPNARHLRIQGHAARIIRVSAPTTSATATGSSAATRASSTPTARSTCSGARACAPGCG